MEPPELPDMPDMPEMDFDELADLPRMLARGPDVDGEDDDERAPPPGKDQPGVHVYRMDQHSQRMVVPRLQMHDEDGADERSATAQAHGTGTATLAVKGPINFQLHAQAGDVDVVATERPQVLVSVSEAPAEEITLLAFGDRVEARFRGRRLLRRGKVHVELPKGSRLEISSMSGDISAQKLGEVRVQTLSGDVKIAGAAKAEVQSISGDVRLDDVSGPVRLRLVSGHAAVLTTGAAPQLDFQSTSGSLDWAGVCAKECHLSAETVSGDVQLALDPKSSFELSYTSHSGELRDEVNLAVKRSPSRKHGMASGWMEATYGKGEGIIEADAFSGNLVLKKK